MSGQLVGWERRASDWLTHPEYGSIGQDVDGRWYGYPPGWNAKARTGPFGSSTDAAYSLCAGHWAQPAGAGKH